MPYESVPGEPMIPGWQIVVTQDLPRAWLTTGKAVWASRRSRRAAHEPTPGRRSPILSNSWDTSLSLFTGLGLGAPSGWLLGSRSPGQSGRGAVVALPAQIMRTFPMMALIPMFQLWFGATFLGMVLFVAFAVGVNFLHRDGERRRQRRRYLRRLRAHAGREPASDLSLGHSASDVSRIALEHPAQPRHGVDGRDRRGIPRRADRTRPDHRLCPVFRLCRPHVRGGAVSAALRRDHLRAVRAGVARG